MADLGRAIDVACFSGSIHKQFLTHQNRQLENYGFTPGQTSSMKRCRGFFFSCSRVASHARRRRKPSMSMPNITPHVCRHTYCSNQAKAGMYPKTLQYLMGHSDISVTMNTYTHLGLEDAVDEMNRMQQLESARKEQEALSGKTDEVKLSKKHFRAG